MISIQKLFSLLILAGVYSCHPVLAWGGRGHHTVCEAAVFLVKEKGLLSSLQQKPHMMGHLCNIPDFYWKSLGAEISQQGNATHFVDMEILGLSFQNIPVDYKKIVDAYTGKKNAYSGKTIFSIPLDFGSNWWRADQFYRRAVQFGSALAKTPPPANKAEEQNDDLPYNKNAYEFYVSLGLMGHYLGDNGQPFHLTADYDGYGAGHGGIHAYFEDAVVGSLPYNLASKVVEKGKEIQNWALSKNKKEREKAPFLNKGSVIEKMKALGLLSFPVIQKIYSLDPVKKPSVDKKEKGMSLKTPAERAPASSVANKYEPLIITQMARSAALLAQLWDQAYVEAGRPQLGVYKSYRFPFTPDFVPPDYFDMKILKSK